MSSRRSEGFTLLELQVAIIVLVLTVLGLMSLLGTHEQLVRSMEDVAAGNQTLYVVPPAGSFDALAGVPAELDADPPVPRPSEPWYPNDVTVQSVAHELDPPRSFARVEVRKAKKDQDDKDKGNGNGKGQGDENGTGTGKGEGDGNGNGKGQGDEKGKGTGKDDD